MSNKKKQTAVEWLVEQLFKQGYFDGNKPFTFTNLDHLQHQAKEMEKEQIKQFWDEGVISATYGKPINFEQYYNETYGGNK